MSCLISCGNVSPDEYSDAQFNAYLQIYILDHIRLFNFYAAVEFIQRQRADDAGHDADHIDNGGAC